MVNTDVLFCIGDAAEDAGDYTRAREAFERGVQLGCAHCMSRLAYLFDVGRGMEADKAEAMRLYQRAWRKGSTVAGLNIAILYRERQNYPAMFRWWKRCADKGDGSALFELGKCYLDGVGVKRCLQSATRCLAAAVSSFYISEAEEEEAQRLLDTLRPRLV